MTGEIRSGEEMPPDQPQSNNADSIPVPVNPEASITDLGAASEKVEGPAEPVLPEAGLDIGGGSEVVVNPEGPQAPEAEAPFDYEARKKEIMDRYDLRMSGLKDVIVEVFGNWPGAVDAGNSRLELVMQNLLSPDLGPREKELAVNFTAKKNEIIKERDKALQEIEEKRHQLLINKIGAV